MVTVPKKGAQIEAALHWVGGAVSRVEVPKGRCGEHRYVTKPELVTLVRDLAAEFTDDQIARIPAHFVCAVAREGE